MKAFLSFKLPEEKSEFVLASNGSDYYGVLWEFVQEVRKKLKYEHQFKTAEEVLEWASNFIYDRIDFDEVD